MKIHLPHVKIAHASHPDKDWKLLVTGFSIITVIAIAIGFGLWFWLQRSINLNSSLMAKSSTDQFQGLTAVTEVMNNRSERFKQIQKTPHVIVDPSLVR